MVLKNVTSTGNIINVKGDVSIGVLIQTENTVNLTIQNCFKQGNTGTPIPNNSYACTEPTVVVDYYIASCSDLYNMDKSAINYLLTTNIGIICFFIYFNFIFYFCFYSLFYFYFLFIFFIFIFKTVPTMELILLKPMHFLYSMDSLMVNNIK